MQRVSCRARDLLTFAFYDVSAINSLSSFYLKTQNHCAKKENILFFTGHSACPDVNGTVSTIPVRHNKQEKPQRLSTRLQHNFKT